MTEKTPTRRHEIRRIDPDPVSILLAAIGALGSFASLAAYVEFRRDKDRERRRARRSVLRAISASREALDDIDIGLEQLERLLERASADVADPSPSRDRRLLQAPTEFGSVNAFFDFMEFSAYQMCGQRITRAFDTLVRETYEIMEAIDDGAIEAPRHLFSELHEVQWRLNTLRVANHPLGDVIAGTRHVTQRMSQIADELERHVAFDRTG